jgi:sulfatase modifying factor 1
MKEQQPSAKAGTRKWLAPAIVIVIAGAAGIALNVMRSKPPPPQESTTAMSAASAAEEFLPTIENKAPSSDSAPEGMVWIPGGEFSMGARSPMDTSDLVGMQATTDSRPIHRVAVEGFWIDATEVTNEQFARFVKATGYVTVAERKPTAADYPNVAPEDLTAGSVVFSPPDHAVPLNDHFQWWAFVDGADWRHPNGPKSSIEGKEKYPVVHDDTGADAYVGVSPVAKYPPNGYGLYDVGGNVWEWVSDWYRPDYYAQLAAAGSINRNPQGPTEPYDPSEPGEKKRVHRGGSYLCTDQYCSRYMVGTRGKGEVTTGTNHLGFRCVQPRDAGS